MSLERASGILLQPTSLPSHGGIGDFGPAAYEFIEFLAAAQQGVWQVLPLNPPADGTSPYSSTSAFAGNPLLISLERLAEQRPQDAEVLLRLATALYDERSKSADPARRVLTQRVEELLDRVLTLQPQNATAGRLLTALKMG